MTPYAPRHFAFHGIAELPPWKVKLYTIRHSRRSEPGVADLAQAQAIAARTLAAIPAGEHHGAAFLILHFGADGDYLLLDSWTAGDILRQSLFLRRDSAVEFEDVTGTGLLACVWELQVIDAERRAWSSHVLAATPDFDTYWSTVLEGVH